MPIDDGAYCRYCINDEGELQTFEEIFERMVQWAMKENKNISRQEAEDRTRAYMRTMPAWKNHPKLQE
jgi:hypothetical protein